MNGATHGKWRSKYGGMGASLMARMKELEREYRRLTRKYGEIQLKNEVVLEALVTLPFRFSLQ